MRLHRRGPKQRGEPEEAERWDLELGDRGAFADKMQRKIAWLEFGPKLLEESLGTSRRPSAYWLLEAPAKLVVARGLVWDRPRNYAGAVVVGYTCEFEDDTTALLRLGLATPRERAEFEARAEHRAASAESSRGHHREVCEQAGLPEDWTRWDLPHVCTPPHPEGRSK